MRKIDVSTFKGVMIGEEDVEGSKIPDVTFVFLETSSGEEIILRVGPHAAFDIVMGLASALGSVVRATAKAQPLISIDAWLVESSGGKAPVPMLHGYLGSGHDARLSFQMRPEHLEPLAHRLLELSRKLAAKQPSPQVPGSPTKQ